MLALKVAQVSEGIKARFEREVTALKDCNYPAIAKIIETDLITVNGNEYWIILEEFLENGTLDDLCQKSLITPSDVRHIGIVLIGALAHLYERDFVHRDIKPANILFRSLNEPVLTDFGIVRILGEKSLTQDFLAQGPGTPMYAAPEQLLNEKSSIDWRTDQFGLALVLAEILLGHHPFAVNKQGTSIMDAIMAVAIRSPLPKENEQRLIQSGFACLVKALAPWPIHRYRKPEQFLSAFKGEK